MEGFKYIQNAIKDGEGKMLLHGQIGNTVEKNGTIKKGINGADFATEMLYLQNLCSEITIDINSIGGSVLDGYSIFSSITDSSVPVNTVVSGLAASTALWCAAAGHEGRRSVKDYASGMMHNSSGSKDKEVQNIIDTSINTMLSGKSKKSPEEIKAMMEKETWLNASQLIENGLADNIIPTGKKIKIKKNSSLENLAEIYNKLITSNMEKVTNILKLQNDASEDSIVSAIQAQTNELTKAKNDLTEAQNKILELEQKEKDREVSEKAALKTKATEMVNAAEKAGKVKKEMVAITIENASKDQASFDFVANMIEQLSSSKEAVKIFNAANAKDANDRSGWDYKKWEKEDEEGLKNMYVTDRDAFNELLKTLKTK